MLKGTDILRIYQDHPEVAAFAHQLKEGEQAKFRMTGLVGSQPAFLLAAIFRHTQRNTFIILNDKEEALYFLNDLQSLMPQKEILFFPASYKRPYQIEEIDNANVLQRAEVMNQLNHTSSGRQLIVTFAEALSEKILNKRSLVKNTLDLKKGETVGMDFVVEVLEEYGFERHDFVFEPGQFSVRGGILDVFSFAHDLPYRVEFFGDEIESLREFDPVNQLSNEAVNRVSLIPNIQKHLIEEEKVSFLEYISTKGLVFVQNVEFVHADLDKQFQRASKYYFDLMERSGNAAMSSDPGTLYLDGDEFKKQLLAHSFVEFGKKSAYRNHQATLEWEGTPQPAFKKEFTLLADHFKQNKEAAVRNLLFSENEKQIVRLHEILAELECVEGFEGVQNDLHAGFLDKKLRIACYTDHEIFERYHKYKSRSHTSRSQALTLKSLKELQPGDYVTHINHGIGKFAGLHRIKTGSHEKEAVKIFFRGGDEIFVNVNSLYKISKYTGKDSEAPRLSKLGSGEWAKKKAKTKARIKALAFDLISLYAKRKSQKGFSFSEDSYLQQELEASFIYVATPDQEKATEAVKKDMESPTPMDRLICGDVGFGKTEIAVRAAFKAATDSKQVAILVPTTILALQHYHTFADRLKDLPVTVDFVNRFRTSKEIRETLKKVENGQVDILIGTHRLASKDVKFKDLGLLVIDEEQKFGVGVKDKLKTMRVNVDTLTLTATPIPRTLQFSLMGVRDMSILATPPVNRQPVDTAVISMDQEVMRDAIAYELKRGGQVFFIHNRINELDEIASIIKRLVPDARIAIAHGQLKGDKMERIMADFIEGEYDVLCCTTIVESGLDIPNANTIIINQAHFYGLSDLHQMRGRVGRSNRKAFCYLIAPPEQVLSRDAKKRLKALEEFSDLGAGFHIALRDLDIRGAGDMLGAEQSGFISEIGYDLYHKILDEAVLELKEEQFPELFEEEIKARKKDLVSDCTVDTDQVVLIPQHYIPGTTERMTFYNRIASADTEVDLRVISQEMLDRFGMLPEEVLGLFDTVRIRRLGRHLGFEKAVLKNGILRLYFPGNKESEYFSSGVFPSILSFAQHNPGKATLKESPKYLSLVINGIGGVKEIYFMLREINQFVKEVSA